MKTKIDWCDWTINPVVGCKNGCKYCYAEIINTRFKLIPCWREPKFFPEKMKPLKTKKRKSIFMDSMSDIGWWEHGWCVKIAEVMEKYSQHNYIFLTKCYKALELASIDLGKNYLKNTFFGVSITTQEQLNAYSKFNYAKKYCDFFSIEPIFEPITIPTDIMPKAIIVGAETGNRKGKVIPQKEWINSLVKQADAHNCKVFIKGSLRKLMGDDFRQDKLPWEIER